MTKWFKGLRKKLLTLVGMAILFLGLVGFVLNLALNNVIGIIEEQKNVSAPRIQMINDLNRTFLTTNQRLWRATSIANVDMRKVLSQYVLESGVEAEKLLESLKTSPHMDEKIKKHVTDISDVQWPKTKKAIEASVEILGQDTPEATQNAIQNINTKVMPEFSELEKTLNLLLADSTQQTKEMLEESVSSSHKLSLYAKIGSVLACLLLILFGTRMASVMAKKLSEISDGIGASTTHVQAASGQLSDSSLELSSGASEAAASLEETVASLEELSSMVKQNANNAKNAGELANKAAEVAVVGEKHIENLVKGMGEIATSANKMEEIINVIDDIAFQTNLLALNAAVEAARAGEQGKGFAVVAEAVRSLAQRSANAAKDINGLIKESSEKVKVGTGLADNGRDALKKIVSSVQEVKQLNQEISAASQEQSHGINQISQAMNQIDKATQSNSVAANQTSEFSQNLANESNQLDLQVQSLISFVTGEGKATTTDPGQTQTLAKNSKGMSQDFMADVPPKKAEDDSRFSIDKSSF